MRFIIYVGIGILVWAGTISIYYPKSPSKATASPTLACSGKSEGHDLLNQLKEGNLTSINDTGNILTISLSPKWKGLSPTTQQKAYQAVVCYANAQNRNFRLIASHESGLY